MGDDGAGGSPGAWWGVAGATALALAVGACGGEESVILDDFPSTSAVVSGEVSAPDGSGVEGATVTTEAWRLGCPAEGGSGPVVGPEGASDAEGGYRLAFRETLLTPQELCLVVRAEPPEGSSLEAVADTGATVMLREDPPLDTARVDLTLRSGS